MKSKTITIQGKDVTLGYCHATEIGFKLLSDEDVNVFMAEAVQCMKEEKMPDIRKTIYSIIAAINAYCEWKGVQPAITDRDLMYESTPLEIGTAFGTILSLRSEFYAMPSGEPVDDNDENQPEEKND
jgi:hypothetical protein